MSRNVGQKKKKGFRKETKHFTSLKKGWTGDVSVLEAKSIITGRKEKEKKQTENCRVRHWDGCKKIWID